MKITQLSADQYEHIRHLFYENYPDLPLIECIIEGILPGQIWVNDQENPTSCLVMTERPYCYISGIPDKNVLLEFISLLKKKNTVKLTYDSITVSAENVLNSVGFSPVEGRQYRYKNIFSTIPEHKNNTPYMLKNITDIETFNVCIWRSVAIELFGTINNYLKHGICFFLWDEKTQQVVSEAHGMASKNLIEIGTVTREAYRGKGLSTIVVNALLQEAMKRHLKPVWTCDEANIASWKVAEHQGMDEMIPYKFYKLHS